VEQFQGSVSSTPSKHLVLCLDGTWCDGDNRPEPQSNIALLSGIIEPGPHGGPPQRIYYDAGVGTDGGLFNRLLGGAFGRGLSANVLAAYRFLSQFYSPGDRLYIFGFSRGAFTARSLCGFMSASGLLTRDACNAANLDFAWSYYRTPAKERYPADRARLSRITHGPDEARIRFLGVFDTVGALGVPKGFLGRLGKRAIQFHDADVSSVVDHSCHALAIDEYRLEFEAALWTEPRHRKYKTVEQAWFPGSHADIGGGCGETGLSDLTLDWMLKRLARFCPELKLRPKGEWPRQLAPNYQAKIYDGRGLMFWRSRWRPLVRTINRCKLDPPRRCRVPGVRPHSRPIGEMVHWSALARWQETMNSPRRRRYQPDNLQATLESLREEITLVVGPDGQPRRLWELTANDEGGPEAKAPATVQRAFNGSGKSMTEQHENRGQVM
jgi:hypothetical protein